MRHSRATAGDGTAARSEKRFLRGALRAFRFRHVAGSAIQENAEDGVTVLKLDFSLPKTGAKSAPVPTDASDAGGVRTDGSKPSLRALLHNLWDQAEFNRWRPGIACKRNRAVIRKFLLEAAERRTKSVVRVGRHDIHCHRLNAVLT